MSDWKSHLTTGEKERLIQLAADRDKLASDARIIARERRLIQNRAVHRAKYARARKATENGNA